MLISEHAVLSEQWDVVANGGMDNIRSSSNQKFQWRCSLDHPWTASPNARTGKGLTGCPVCSGKKVLAGFNDLASQNPELAAEWHPTLNAPVTAQEVTPGSQKTFWWRGECGHEWDARVSPRSAGQACPYCAGKRILPGFNDLASQHPEVAAFWHPTKNGDLTPDVVAARSSKRTWWLCERGHEYENIISEQTSPRRQQPCPVCAGRKLVSGVNDVKTLLPELAAQWHPTKNGDLQPSECYAGGHRVIHWQGSCGHEWSSSVSTRLNGYGCPVCAGKVVLPGFNDLASQNSRLASLWHPTKNGNLTPESITPGSNTEVWWVGPCNHEWKAKPKDVARTVESRNGCPTCAGKRVIAGDNDLATLFPEVAAQWHLTKNGDLTPSTVPKSYGTPVWWRCPQGHEWQASPAARTSADGTWRQCFRCGTSSGESDILKALKAGAPHLTFQTNIRSIIPPRELDIYIPEKQVAIEFNGIYWHTEEQGKDRHYHRNKWAACKEQGIQLIQVWEDEWKRNPQQVTRMLLHKLGVQDENHLRVMARKTVVVTLRKQGAEEFLDKHHVQGHADGTYYLGLVDKSVSQPEDGLPDGVHAVLVLKNEAGTGGKTLNIIRYATSATVPGGFTKLLKHAERAYQPEAFITFSDNCVSDGGLYESHGFVADKELPPDYMYVVRAERKHKFGYRIKRFRNDPELLWEEGLTERELAQLNGLSRIWDAGKTRWMKTV